MFYGLFSAVSDVGIDILGGGGVGVAQELLGIFEVYVILIQHGSISVTDPVRGTGDTGLFAIGSLLLLKLHSGEDAAGLVGEDIASAWLEFFQQLIHQGDRASAGSGLGDLDHGDVADVVDRFVDGDSTVL